MLRLLTIFLSIALLGNAGAATFGLYTYTVNADNASVTITDYDISGTGALVIVDTLGGYPVTSIGTSAFFNCTNLTSVIIPDSVTSIGEDAFQSCTSLTSINIPNSAISIGTSAFAYCTNLTSVNIGNSVTSIGEEAFESCTSLTSVTLPNNIEFTSIGDSTFSNCSSLTSITIPNSVTSIGNYAFNTCSSLTSITIPNSVTSIGNYAFNTCTGLTSVIIPDSVTSIGFLAFNGTNLTYSLVDGIKYLFSDSYAFLIDGSSASVALLIPTDVDGKPVRLIGGAAFFNCTSLTSITIPNSVISIGAGAFYACTSLTSVTFPNNIEFTSIRAGAFYGCTGLTSVTIPNSVTSIGDEAFSNCSSLTSVTIPDSVTSIGDSTFSNCSSLTSVTIPDSVTSIGDTTFRDCTSLTSVTIPDSVTSIGSEAFFGCSSLTSVTLPYNFAYSIPPNAVPIYTFDRIVDALKNDPDFIAAVAQAMLAAENNSGFATKEELPLVEQAGIDQVLADPASYSLATSDEVASSFTAGQEDVLSDPVAYDLYDEASIMEINVATPLLSMTNVENQAEIEFAIESSDDLQTWTVDERILRTVEGQGDKYFVRVSAGAPYINPSVLVYAHPTLGDILTNAEGYVLYGFAFNSAGQDPAYTGSSWNFVAATATPEPDAGVTATLAGATFGNVSGGPWLTVNGLPAYTYPLDTAPYQANGHGSGDVWFTLNPDGSLNTL